MRIKLLLLLLIFFGCRSSPKTLKINCTLVNPQVSNVNCGVLSIWVGMKFIMEDSGKEFIGLINCPEMYDSTFFSKGRRYYISMRLDSIKEVKDIIVNNFTTEKLSVYRIKEIKKR